MNAEQIAKLKELAQASLPEPGETVWFQTYQFSSLDNADAEFICAVSPAAMLELIARIDELDTPFCVKCGGTEVCGDADRTTSPVSQMTDATIREIFMAHGFTIKEGQTDLKPYVYAAARALLSAAPAAPVAEPAPAVGSSMWSLIDEYARAKAVYEYSTDRDEADRQRKERDAAKEALQAALAAQPQPVAEQGELVRELTKASVGSCNCGMKTPDHTLHSFGCRYRAIESATIAIAASQQAAEPVARKIVAWTEKDGDEWVVYDAESDTGQHIAKYQTKDHGVHVFPIYEDCKP